MNVLTFLLKLTSSNSPNLKIPKLTSPNSHNFKFHKLTSPNSPNFIIPKLTLPNSSNLNIIFSLHLTHPTSQPSKFQSSYHLTSQLQHYFLKRFDKRTRTLFLKLRFNLRLAVLIKKVNKLFVPWSKILSWTFTCNDATTNAATNSGFENKCGKNHFLSLQHWP